jgi:hypothetical protein
MGYGLALVVAFAFMLLPSGPAKPVGEGPSECLWGTDCTAGGSGRITTLTGLETCLESTSNDHCTLAQGSYDVGASTLVVNIPVNRRKTLFCETGADITGTGDPTIWIYGGGDEVELWIRGCTFNNSASKASLRIGGSFGRVWLDNVTSLSSGTMTYLGNHHATLGGASDLCGANYIHDESEDFSDVVAGDWVWLASGATSFWFTARIASVSNDNHRINFSNSLGQTPTVCNDDPGDKIQYKVYHNPYGTIIDVNYARIYVADSMFYSGFLARNYLENRGIELHDVSLAAFALDEPTVRPCLVLEGGAVQVSNSLPSVNVACSGYQLDHTGVGTVGVSVEGGVYYGTFYVGTYAHNFQIVTMKGISLDSILGPVVYTNRLQKLFAEVNLVNVTGTPALWGGILEGGSSSAAIEDVHLDVRVRGDVAGTNHLSTDQILGPILDAGSRPLFGCVTISDDINYSSNYRIVDGVVTNDQCDLWASVNTLGTLQGMVKATSHASSPVSVVGRGEVYDNSGATGEVQFNLPVATKGKSAMFYQRNAEVFEIHPNGSELIYFPGLSLSPGDCLQGPGADNSFVSLFAIADGVWSAISYQGVWTDDGDCG